MSGITPSDLVSRRTGDITIDARTTDDLNVSANWYTQGTVKVADDQVRNLGYARACAYLIGGVQAHSADTGAEIPPPMLRFFQDVQAAYRDGLTDRYASDEAAGAKAERANRQT